MAPGCRFVQTFGIVLHEVVDFLRGLFMQVTVLALGEELLLGLLVAVEHLHGIAHRVIAAKGCKFLFGNKPVVCQAGEVVLGLRICRLRCDELSLFLVRRVGPGVDVLDNLLVDLLDCLAILGVESNRWYGLFRELDSGLAELLLEDLALRIVVEELHIEILAADGLMIVSVLLRIAEPLMEQLAQEHAGRPFEAIAEVITEVWHVTSSFHHQRSARTQPRCGTVWPARG